MVAHKGDVFDADSVASAVGGHDAAIICPGSTGLRNKNHSAGHYTATNTGPITRINRADIANALVDQLEDTTYSRAAISVTN